LVGKITRAEDLIRKLQDAIGTDDDSGVWVVPKTDTGKLRENKRKDRAKHIFSIMKMAYSESEFQELCFVFGIDYDTIQGDTKPLKMMAFVTHYYRRNQLDTLVNFLSGDRPEWNWQSK
jgi:hypothetical protein